MKCFYHADPDGKLSAYWVKNHVKKYETGYKQDKFIPLEYKDPVPLDEVAPGERVYIVDFSFQPEVMKALIAKVGDISLITWIDHHKTVIGTNLDLEKQMPGLRCAKYAACVLSYIYFNTPFGISKNRERQKDAYIVDDIPEDIFQQVPRFCQLVGDYDAWRWDFGDEALFFYTGIQASNTAPESHLWETLCNNPETLDSVIKDGKLIVSYKEQFAKEYTQTWGFKTTIDGFSAYACNIARPGSIFFESLKEHPDILIGFVQSSNGYQVSLYSDRIDVGNIAKKFGGGGHKGAAGFYCTTLPFSVK